MKLFLQKNAKFSSAGDPPPDPRASGGWGLCSQIPSLRQLGTSPPDSIGLRRLGAPPPDPQNSHPFEFLATRLDKWPGDSLIRILKYVLGRDSVINKGVMTIIKKSNRFDSFLPIPICILCSDLTRQVRLGNVTHRYELIADLNHSSFDIRILLHVSWDVTAPEGENLHYYAILFLN